VGNLTVTPKPLTAAMAASNRVYDGGVLATVSGSSADIVTGVKVSFANTSATFNNKNAGTGKTVSVTGISISGDDAGNYALRDTAASTTAAITPKTVTVSGVRAQDKVYDGTTQAAVLTADAVFNGIEAGDVLSVTATGQFDTRHAGHSKTVSLSSTFGGHDVDNYTITPQSTSTARITPAPLVVTASAARKTYDGNTAAPGVGTAGTLVGAAAGDTVGFGGTQTFADKQAGNGKTVAVTGVRLVDGSQTDVTGNYAITYVDNQNGVIDKANASMTSQASSTVYNGGTQSQTGVVLTGFVAGDDVQASGLASGRDVGSYQSSLSAIGADVGNYNITFNNASLSISKRPASLSALGQSVVYNGKIQSLNGTQGSGFVAGDALIFGGLPSGRNVGQYTSSMTVSGADAANYDITLGNATLIITPKGASIIARPERVTYNGQTQVQSPAQLEGFVAGDDIRVSGLATGRNAGVYGSGLSASGADVGNYSITYQNGALTIGKAPLQFADTAVQNKIYDGNTKAQVTAGSIVGLVGNETLNVVSVAAEFADPEVGNEKPVQVVFGLGDGQNGGMVSNYDWSPQTMRANITRPAIPNQSVPSREVDRSMGRYSRIAYLGFGGLNGFGAATGQLHYNIPAQSTQDCSPTKLENCVCELLQDKTKVADTHIELEVCRPLPVLQSARP
jgi:hypothetical protein